MGLLFLSSCLLSSCKVASHPWTVFSLNCQSRRPEPFVSWAVICIYKRSRIITLCMLHQTLPAFWVVLFLICPEKCSFHPQSPSKAATCCHQGAEAHRGNQQLLRLQQMRAEEAAAEYEQLNLSFVPLLAFMAGVVAPTCPEAFILVPYALVMDLSAMSRVSPSVKHLRV